MKNGMILLVSLVLLSFVGVASAQDVLPYDNGLATYHTSPRYRESESHPLRILAYAFHPVGWVAREVVFRPLSYLASSTETSRSVMGYREPFDYRQPECFSSQGDVPNCRSLSPFNYGGDKAMADESSSGSMATTGERSVYFPDVNYDFNIRKLSDLGMGRSHQIAEMLKKEPGLNIVLEGHADQRGSDKYNEKLGMDRAEALKAELVGLGVSADRISTITFGESRPVFPNEEPWARAVNRRVEVHVSDVK